MKNQSSPHPDFPYTVDRTLDGQGEIELAIEVKHYRQGTVLKPGQYMHPSDPAFDPGDLELGAAHYLDGRECVLTELEREAAINAFWNQ